MTYNVFGGTLSLTQSIIVNLRCIVARFTLQSVDGVYVCVAFSSEYKIINMDTGRVQELFSFDSGHVLPTITKISRVSLA